MGRLSSIRHPARLDAWRSLGRCRLSGEMIVPQGPRRGRPAAVRPHAPFRRFPSLPGMPLHPLSPPAKEVVHVDRRCPAGLPLRVLRDTCASAMAASLHVNTSSLLQAYVPLLRPPPLQPTLSVEMLSAESAMCGGTCRSCALWQPLRQALWLLAAAKRS